MNLLAIFTLVVIATIFNVGPSEGKVHTGCGGTVGIAVDGSTEISYKEDEIYGYEERCIWALVPEDPAVVFSSISVTFNKSGLGHSLSDGFYFYRWTDSGLFDGSTVWAYQLGTTTFETSQGFLFFSSDYGNTDYTGFLISVTGVVSDAPSKIEERLVINSENLLDRGSLKISYPEFPAVTYKNNAKLAIVLRQDRNSQLVERNVTLTYLDTEQGIDLVEVQNLRPFTYRDGTHFTAGTYSGHHPEGFQPTGSYESSLVLFKSDHEIAGRGFQVSWD